MGHPGGVPCKAWPLFNLCVTTPRLTLQLPHDVELLTLAEKAAERVLPREQAGFMGRWTQLRSPEFERSFMQFHWGLRANWTPARWSLELGIYPDGHDEPVGMMGAGASDFERLHSATTGSWLLPEWRGRGLGKEARAAVLHLLFDGLGAREARSGAHPDNAASNAVSRELGYHCDGTEPMLTGAEEAVTVTRLLLPREDWLPRRRSDITCCGVESCRSMFGL